MSNVRGSTVLIGAGGIGLLLFIASKSKAANAPNGGAKRIPSTTGTAAAATPRPASSSAAGKPLPALPSSSSSSSDDFSELELVPVPVRDLPQEGQPLAWDKTEHPLADRGKIDDVDMVAAAPTAAAAKPKPPTPSAGTAAAAKPKPAATKPAKPKASAATTVEPTAPRSPKEAAQALFDYASRVLKAGKGASLGTANAPSSTVRAAQSDMAMHVADGIYGPDTRARGKELLGKTFPVRK